jgi:ubiquitin carboxyl-terminal hydrolase L3
MVPGPVKALVLLFPIDDEGEEKRKRDDARIATEGQPMLDKTIFWVKQTVSYLVVVLESVTECG